MTSLNSITCLSGPCAREFLGLMFWLNYPSASWGIMLFDDGAPVREEPTHLGNEGENEGI